jgi:hypothetical protein
VTPTTSVVGMRSGDGAAACERVSTLEFRDSHEREAHLELKAVDPDRHRTDHARIELLVVARVLGGADVDELPFQVYHAPAFTYMSLFGCARDTHHLSEALSTRK